MNVVDIQLMYIPNLSRSGSLANADIYVGEPDTDPEIVGNQKQISVQQENGAIVAVSQPISTSAGGVPLYNGSPVTILVNGAYSLKVNDSFGSQIYYVPVNLDSDTTLLSYYDCDLAAAVAAIGSSNDTHLIIDCAPDDLTASLIITDNITIEWRRGFTIGGAYTLTFFTPENIIASPRQQLFESNITVVFTNPGTISPHWWDIDIDDGTTVADQVFNRAITSAAAGSYIKVLPSTSYYNCTGTIDIDKALRFGGDETTGVDIRQTTSNTGLIEVTVSNVEIDHLKLTGPQYGTEQTSEMCLRIYGADSSNFISDIKVHHVEITSWGYSGIRQHFVENFDLSYNTITNCFYEGIQDLSGRYGLIHHNYIDGIIRDSTFDDSYGISTSKSTGTEADQPVPHDISMSDNVVRNVNYWHGISTHGGYNLLFNDNTVTHCRDGITLTSYVATAGEERAPTNCTVANNVVANPHDAGDIPTRTDQRWGVAVIGHSSSSTFALNNVVTGNAVSGFGDQDGAIASNPPSAITCSIADTLLITGNTVYDSGRNGINVNSSDKVSVEGNTIDTIGGTAAVAATGTITFANNPSNGDTITINGAVYTFVDPAAPTTDYEIDIKASLALTLDEIIAVLNASTGSVTGLATDGRVSTATYTEDGVDELTITFDSIGTSGNSFSLAASADTPSGALLTGGAAGSSGIHISNSDDVSVRNNSIDVDAHTGILVSGTITNRPNLGPNTHIGTGPKYDCGGTSTSQPQNLAGRIEDQQYILISNYDIPSIAAGSDYDIYVAAPGNDIRSLALMNSTAAGTRALIQNITPGANYIRVTFTNTTSGAINPAASTDFVFRVSK
jgi:hypothetical protein